MKIAIFDLEIKNWSIRLKIAEFNRYAVFDLNDDFDQNWRISTDNGEF